MSTVAARPGKPAEFGNLQHTALSAFWFGTNFLFIPLTTIFRGIIPFLVTDFVHLGVLIAFPALALWLPQVLGAA